MAVVASLWIAALVQSAPAAVPSPPERAFAECRSPVYAVDYLICDDAALLAGEDEMRRLWLARTSPAGSSPWIEDQEIWLRRRALCAFRDDQRACVEEAMSERLRILSASPGSVAGVTAVCNSSTGTERLQLAIRKENVAAFDEFGEVAFVAVPVSRNWTPFVQIVSARRLSFRRQDGATLRCRPDRSPRQGDGEPR